MNGMQVSIGCETFHIAMHGVCASTLEHCLNYGLEILLLSLSLYPRSMAVVCLVCSRFIIFFVHTIFTSGQRCVNQLSINCHRLSIRPISESLQNINHNRNRMKSNDQCQNRLNEWLNHWLLFNLVCACAAVCGSTANALDPYEIVTIYRWIVSSHFV